MAGESKDWNVQRFEKVALESEMWVDEWIAEKLLAKFDFDEHAFIKESAHLAVSLLTVLNLSTVNSEK